MRKNKDTGFSLLELLIVVAIILIIAKIAIPSLFRSRQAANEASAVSSLRTVATAQITFGVSHAGSFGSLAELVTEALVDNRFGTGAAIAGYTYSITSGFATFTAQANPGGNSGRYNYVVYEDGVIRYNTQFPTGFATNSVVQ